MPTKSHPATQGGLEIFVCGKSDSNRASLASLFEDGGDYLHAHWLETIEDVIEACSHEDPDVILLELAKGDVSALQVLTEHIHEIPIVVITEGDDDGRREALKQGAQDFLDTRHGAEATLRMLRQTIERGRVSRELTRVTHELEHTKSLLSRLVLVDSLTTLLNKKGLQEAFLSELTRLRAGEGPLLAMLIDFHGFSRINASFGYGVGDAVIQEAAKVIKKNTNPQAQKGRVDADEFLVFLPQTSLEEGQGIAANLIEQFERIAIPLAGNKQYISATAAIIELNPRSCSFDELLTDVHLTLHECREQGIPVLGRKQSDPHEQAESFRQVVSALREPDNFLALRQAIVRLDNLSVHGYEMLTRSVIPGFERPVDFFRLSLHSNQLTDVEQATLVACVKEAAKSPKDAQFHLNLFPSTLKEISPAKIADLITAYLSPSQCCLEISEKEVIGSPVELIEPVEILRDMGFDIAMDDVGFGHSSVETLIMIKPRLIKIDRAMIAGVAGSPERIEMLDRLCRIGKSLDLDMVAEGIENEDDLDQVRRLGIPFGQGFFWGSPK